MKAVDTILPTLFYFAPHHSRSRCTFSACSSGPGKFLCIPEKQMVDAFGHNDGSPDSLPNEDYGKAPTWFSKHQHFFQTSKIS